MADETVETINRDMYVGDTGPDDLLQVTDETFVPGDGATVLNFTGCTIQVKYIGDDFQFSGDGASIWPATADPDEVHFWNCSYAFADDDTSEPDTYKIFVTVTNADSVVTTYATDCTLTVHAFPVPA